MGYWHHLISWWQVRNLENVLLLSYEDMKRDPAKAIKSIAAHLGIAMDENLLQLTLEYSSFEYMRRNHSRFDEIITRNLRQRLGLLCNQETKKIRSGQVGGYRQHMNETLVAQIAATWQDFVTPALGFSDYSHLEQALSEECLRRSCLKLRSAQINPLLKPSLLD